MEISAIRQFLANPEDFARGVELYCLYGTNEALKHLFSNSRKSDFILKKLLEGLEKVIVDNPLPKASPKTVAGKTTGSPDEWVFTLCGRYKAHYTELPENIWTLKKQNGQYYREIKKLHAKLEDTPEGPELAELVTSIVNICKASRANRVVIDYFLQYRRNAPEAKEKTTNKTKEAKGLSDNPALLVQERNNLRSQISKAAKKGNVALVASLTEERDMIIEKLIRLTNA